MTITRETKYVEVDGGHSVVLIVNDGVLSRGYVTFDVGGTQSKIHKLESTSRADFVYRLEILEKGAAMGRKVLAEFDKDNEGPDIEV